MIRKRSYTSWTIAAAAGLLGWAATASAARAQTCCGGGAAPALAFMDGDGKVVVRQFMFVFDAPKKVPVGEQEVALGGKQPVPPPKMSAHEQRFTFHAKDMQVFSLDGKKVDAAVWQKALKKETAVLFAGCSALEETLDEAGPGQRFVSLVRATGEELPPNVTQPPIYQQVYKKETLVLFSAVAPVEQKHLKEPKGAFPNGPPPQLAEAAIDGKMLRLRERMEFQFYEEAATEEKGKDGEPRKVTIKIKHTNVTTNTRELPAQYVKVYDGSGKQLAMSEAASKLSKDLPVAVASDNRPVDPLYLSMVRPGTLVVAIPQAAPVAPPAPKEKALPTD